MRRVPKSQPAIERHAARAWAARILRTLAILLSLGVCWAQAPAPRWQIIDSGFPADGPPLGFVLWADNDRVLFLGVDLDATSRLREGRATATYLWNIPAGTVARYRDKRLILPCVDNDNNTLHYFYSESPTGQPQTFFKGPLGSERPQSPPPHQAYNRFDCSFHDYDDDARKWARQHSRRVTPARVEHGFFILNPEPLDPKKLLEVKYVFMKRHPHVAIPLDIKPASSIWVQSWTPHTQTYLIRDPNDKSAATDLWLVSPSGQTKHVRLFRRDWDHEADVLLTKGGIVSRVISSRSTRFDHAGSAGLYLLVDFAPQALVQGHIPLAALSPDGCRLAFIHTPHKQGQVDGYKAWRAGKAANTLRIVDFCKD